MSRSYSFRVGIQCYGAANRARNAFHHLMLSVIMLFCLISLQTLSETRDCHFHTFRWPSMNMCCDLDVWWFMEWACVHSDACGGIDGYLHKSITVFFFQALCLSFWLLPHISLWTLANMSSWSQWLKLSVFQRRGRFYADASGKISSAASCIVLFFLILSSMRLFCSLLFIVNNQLSTH